MIEYVIFIILIDFNCINKCKCVGIYRYFNNFCYGLNILSILIIYIFKFLGNVIIYCFFIVIML